MGWEEMAGSMLYYVILKWIISWNWQLFTLKWSSRWLNNYSLHLSSAYIVPVAILSALHMLTLFYIHNNSKKFSVIRHRKEKILLKNLYLERGNARIQPRELLQETKAAPSAAVQPH